MDHRRVGPAVGDGGHPVNVPAQVAEAYRVCEDITRTQARNFFYGIRLLSPVKRRALSAVYAFARRVDDIGDGDLPAEEKLRSLKHARDDLHTAGPDSSDPVLLALTHAASVRPIPLAAFDELIEGCEADVRGTQYATFDNLLHYCRCVAGSIGRLSLGVFGAEDITAAAKHADALGVALQLTNILRDVREDLLHERVYLPSEDLERFGVRADLEGGELAGSEQDWSELIRFQAERAQRWYDDGLCLLPMLDWRSRACCASMAGIYHELLRRIAADPHTAMQRRMSLSGWQKVGVAARSLAGIAP
jgi:15-cis-phytoene synthase